MANQSSDLLAAIGAIQTLVENFPMGLLSALKVKQYSSSLEFLLDALRTLGVNDKEIITFILEDLIGINDLDDVDFDSWDDMDSRFQNNAFIQSLESAFKFLIAEILANIVSCSVWPKIPDEAITSGVDLPLSILDPSGLLNTCPSSENGRKKYIGIPTNTPPSELYKSRDLNAFVWYCINQMSPMSTSTWTSATGGNICQFQNRGYKKINMKIHEDFSGDTLFAFNKKYLDSITIFSPKTILMNIFDELLNGLPNVEVNLGIDEIYNEAVFSKMIDTIVSNDDMGVEDCYYKFSNDDWNMMIEDSELRKYNAKKYGDASNTANVIDKDSVMDLLNEAASAKTMHDKVELVSQAIYSAAKTQTIEYDKLVDEASYETKLTVDFEFNSGWIYNILSTIIRPIIKSAMTPKVMALIIVNYEVAGALNLSEIDTSSPMSAILDFVKKKLMGIFAALIKKVKDMIVQAVLNFFNKKIAPLITKYVTAKLLEKIEGYLDLLRQAMECIDIFGFPYFLGNGVQTGLDVVNYADITKTKNNPNSVTC